MPQNPNQAPALPPVDEAYSIILHDVYGSNFATKLASHGYPVKTAEQLQEAVRLARRLREAEQDTQLKEAAHGTDIFSAGNQALDAVYRSHGFTDDSSIKEAALATAKSNPRVFNAVLSLKEAELAAQRAAAAA